MSLTSGQLDATQRRTLQGVVYALSGALKSRVSAIPDGAFYWSTSFVPLGSGPTSGHEYEPFLTLPARIQEEVSYQPGEPPPLHPIPLTFRNLPYRHKESLVAALVDDDYAWEGTEASLWVAYLRPGQTVSDLSSSDWIPQRLRGQFGAPKDIRPDGFTIPLHSRDVKRRGKLNLRRATSGDFPNIDPADDGRVIPLMVGSHPGWVKALRTDAGLYGFSKSAPAGAGTFYLTSPFVKSRWDAAVGNTFFIGDTSVTVTLEDVTATAENILIFNIQGASGLPINLPDGKLVQERKSEYRFTLTNHPMQIISNNIDTAFLDTRGNVIPPPANSPTSLELVADTKALSGYRTDVVFTEPDQPPVLQPNLASSGTVSITQENVTQQPEFSTPSTNLSTKLNYPSDSEGSIGVSHEFAADGNENTGASMQPGESVTLLFNGAPGSFSNDETINSVIHIVVQGQVDITAGSYTKDLNLLGKGQFRFQLPNAEDFDQHITVTASLDGNGAVLYEAWWEHDLSQSIEINRQTDVAINVDIASDIGSQAEMEPVDGVVFNVSQAFLADFFGGGASGVNPWAYDKEVFFSEYWKKTNRATPAAVFADLQRWLLEDGSADYSRYINSGVYNTARRRWRLLGVSGLGFAITKPITWEEMEASLAAQTRCHAFYGPEGHELVVMETDDTLETSSVELEFRLPGVPEPNASQSASGPMMIRGNTSDVENTVLVHWERKWLEDSANEVGSLYQRSIEVSNSDSVTAFGERRRVQGPRAWWGWGLRKEAHGVPGVVSGIAQFYADRFAFGVTRFTFETGHVAAKLGKMSLIRVVFAAAEGVYRNVPCVVESISRSPINGEQYTITARTVGQPRKGLTFALTWDDLFTDATDKWHTRITGRLDRWVQYWAVQG